MQTLLLKVMGHKQLLESNDDVMLLQKIQLRAPYVTPLNVLQVRVPCCMSMSSHSPRHPYLIAGLGLQPVYIRMCVGCVTTQSSHTGLLHVLPLFACECCCSICIAVAQVYCLKALRAIESGQGIDPRYKVRPSAALPPAEQTQRIA